MEYRSDQKVGAEKRTPSEQVLGRELGGFDFDLSFRNAAITAGGPSSKLPKAHKTGTTICGVAYSGGVVLGADTRATEDTIVCDKNCEKIHYIAPNIYCCGAGTSADTENTTRVVSSKLELLRLATSTSSRVVTAMTMLKRYLFRYQGNVSAALVLGGVDCTGSHLYTVYPHGSTDKLPFVSMGSGSLAAMAILESGYKDGLTEQEAIQLVAAAIRAGIFNDLGSGSNVDLTVLRQKPAEGTPQVTILRNYQTPNKVEDLRKRVVRPSGRIIPIGATTVIQESFTKHSTVYALPVAAGGAGAGGSNAAASGMTVE